MKKITIIILVLFIFQQSSSQNYKTIIPEIISHYGEYLYPIQIDSITNSGDSIFYHNFKMIRYQNNGYYRLHSSSWTGENIIILPDGYNMFVNKDLDTIKINTSAEINGTWQLYKFSDNSYVEAKVTNKEFETFIGISDSVKTIHLQIKDPYGNNINNEINDKYLKISKNHGFTRIFNFYEFPFNNVNDFLYPFVSEMEMTGFGEYGHQNFGASEIFGYNINDERHIIDYHFEFDCNEAICELLVKNILKVENKYISDNHDTIIYTYDKCGQEIYEGGVYTGNWHYQTSEIIILSDPINESLNNLNFQPYHNIIDNEYIVTVSTDTAKWIKLIFTGTDNYLSLDYQNPENVDDFNKIYYKGLGGDYFWFYTICCVDEKRVVYSKKGENEWGTPYNCSDFSNVRFLKTNDIKIFPNPSTGIINLNLNNKSIQQITICDLTGKQIFKTNKQQETIDITSFTSGIYIITIQTDKRTYKDKILKR